MAAEPDAPVGAAAEVEGLGVDGAVWGIVGVVSLFSSLPEELD